MNDLVWFLLCLIIPVSIILLYAYDQEQKKKKILAAKKSYEEALAKLRQVPQNTELREEALKRGRYYADLSRRDKRSVFDEVALMNDLNAIQATSLDPVSKQPDVGDVKERLAKLEGLYTEGIITKEEYETRRQEILSEI